MHFYLYSFSNCLKEREQNFQIIIIISMLSRMFIGRSFPKNLGKFPAKHPWWRVSLNLLKLVSLVDAYLGIFQEFGELVLQQTPEGPASELLKNKASLQVTLLLLDIRTQKIASSWSCSLKQLFLKFVGNTNKQNHTKMQFQQSYFRNFSLVYNAFLSKTSGRILLKKKLSIMRI